MISPFSLPFLSKFKKKNVLANQVKAYQTRATFWAKENNVVNINPGAFLLHHGSLGIIYVWEDIWTFNDSQALGNESI